MPRISNRDQWEVSSLANVYFGDEINPVATPLCMAPKPKPQLRQSPRKVSLTDLRFGVEVEFVDLSENEVREVLSDMFTSGTLRDAWSRKWDVVSDGSLSDNKGNCGEDYTGELVTPPLRYYDIPLLQNVIRELRRAGGTTNHTCGVHVHVESKYLGDCELARLVNLVKRHEDILYRALEVKDTREGAFCRRLPRCMPTQIKDKKGEFRSLSENDPMKDIWYEGESDKHAASQYHYHVTRYYGLNLHSHWFRGTVEYRFFNGTLHAGKIRAYVALALALTAKATQGNGTGNGKELYRGDRKQCLEQLRRFMTNIGLDTEEFKNCRLHLLNGLLLKKRELECVD